jgi:hypothetical protein
VAIREKYGSNNARMLEVVRIILAFKDSFTDPPMFLFLLTISLIVVRSTVEI